MGALDFSDKADPADGALDFSDASLEAHNRAPSIMDVAKAALVGYVPDTAKALGWGLEKIGVEHGTEMRKAGAQTERDIVESMTPGGQRAYSAPVFEGDGLSDLHLGEHPGGALAMGAFRSAPQMAMMAPIGAPVAAGVSRVIPAAARAAPGVKGLLARNAPGALGFGGAEGLQAATQNAEQTQSEIEGMSHADLEKSPRYLELLQTMGREEARKTLASEAAGDVFKRTLPWTGGVGIATGGGALGELVKPGVKSVVKGIVKGAGEEALQEAPQSAGEELIQNLAKRDYVDPTQDPWKGVAAAAASGAAIGGVTGGALGGGAHAFSGHTVDGEVTGRETAVDPLAAARGAAQDTESAAAVVRRTVDSIKQRVAAMGAQPKEATNGNEQSGDAAADETGARTQPGKGAQAGAAPGVSAKGTEAVDVKIFGKPVEKATDQELAEAAQQHPMSGFREAAKAELARRADVKSSDGAGTETGTSRTTVSPGVRNLADDEAALSQPAQPAVQVLRGAGDQGVRAVDGELRDVPGGRGAPAVAGTDAGPRGQQQGVRAGERPLGAPAGAEAQSAERDALRVRGESAAAVGVGEGKESAAGPAGSQGESVRVVDRAGADDAGRRSAEALQDANAGRKNADDRGVGPGAGDQLRDAQGANPQGRPAGQSPGSLENQKRWDAYRRASMPHARRVGIKAVPPYVVGPKAELRKAKFGEPIADGETLVWGVDAMRALRSKRLREIRRPNPSKDSLNDWIAKRGGLDITERLDVSGDDKNHAINASQWLFTKKGAKVDDLARAAWEDGFLSNDEYGDVDGGVQALKDKIRAELGGTKQYSQNSDAASEAEQQRASDDEGYEQYKAQALALADEVEGRRPDDWGMMTEDEKGASLDEFFGSDSHQGSAAPGSQTGARDGQEALGRGEREPGQDDEEVDGERPKASRRADAKEVAARTDSLFDAPAAKPEEKPAAETEAPGDDAKPLFIPLNTEYYDAFADGSKDTEYRKYGPQWNEKTAKVGRRVVLSKGYGKQARLEGTVVDFKRGAPPDDPAWKKIYGDAQDAVHIKIKVDARPALELKGQTEAEIKAEADAKQRADEEKKKKEAAPAPEEFNLSGSDRKADVAAAHGQKDLLAAPAEKEPADEKGRDAFTVERLNDSTDQMEKTTFRRREYVRAHLSDETSAEGEIVGISHADRKFRIGGVWYDFGRAYKAKRPAVAEAPKVALSKAVEQSNAKTGGDLTEVDRLITLADHDAFRKRLYDGDVSIEEYKAQFERVVAQKDRLIEQLEGMKKDDLLKQLGGFSAQRYKSEKKERIVQAAYDDMEMGFTLSRGLSFSMGKGAQEAALRKMIDGTTAADLKEFADRVAAQRKERKDRIEGIKKALKNPETLEEFEDFIKYHKAGEPGLTPEQRAKYDELVAEKTKGKRVEDQEKKATVQAAGELVGATITETKHTQKGHDLFVVKLERRVERDVYDTLNTAAKKLGGYYSSYTKGGAVAGFQFKAKADAEAFQKLAVEGDAAAATEAAIERKGDRRDEKKNAAAQRMAEMADKLEASANESLNRDRHSNTNKRARQAASAEAGARSDIAFAKTLRNLSEAIESGEAKHLDGIRTKAQVATLTKLAESARFDTLRKQYPSYAEREKHEDRPLEVGDIDAAEYPALTGRKEDFQSAANRFDSKPGSKRLAERFRKMAQAIHDDEWHAMGRQIVEEAVEKAGADTYAVPWHWAENLAKIKRLEAAGIPNVNVLRAALREFIQFKGEQPKADKVKELERALVGKDVGFDFFPTPAPLAARMAEMLDVKPGMRVLEPSAGKGNLADAVRDEYPGAEVDVVEQSNTLREILKEKGYSILGHDFNDFEKSIKYDRIIMNPPFSDGIDADHVRKAYAHLAPGGRLVAIAGEGIFFRKDKKAQEFRTWFDSVNGTSEQMEGAFLDRHEVATTGVNSRLLVIDKPEERAPMASRRSVTTLPAFKRWFSGSKVVDSDGNPMVVYHGTNAKMTTFDVKPFSIYWGGKELNFKAFYFTDNESVAESYGRNVMPVYLSMQRPKIVDAKGETWDEFNPFGVIGNTVAGGEHDGIIVKNIRDESSGGGDTESTVYVVLKPEQIKSVNNDGTFDSRSGDIMASRQSENIEDYKPQTKTGKSGQPLFWNDHIALAKPDFQHSLADGERTVGYGIYDVKNLDADGKPTKVGSLLMDLGEDDKVVGLQNIEIRQPLRQSGKGLGETVIATLLAHNGALPIRIHNIQHHRDDGWDALPFWRKMGTRIDNFSTDPEVEINGWLSRTDYLKARGVGGKLSRGLNRTTDLPAESGTADDGRGRRGEADRGRARAGGVVQSPAVGAGAAQDRLRADAGREGAGERGRAGAAGRNAAGLTPEQVRARLIEAFGPKIDTLLQDKVLNIVATPADLPPKLAAAAQSLDEAWYDPKANDGEGAIYFIASGLRPERVVPVLLHELGEHYNLPKMLGADGYAALHREVRALHARGTSSAVEDAWRHVRENYPSLKEADVDFASEVIAKVGESAAGRNLPFFKRLLAAVRTWLLKLGLKANLVSNLTDEDLRTLVEASARQAIRKAGNAMAFGRGVEKRSVGNHPPASSVRKGELQADKGRLIELLGKTMYHGDIANITFKELFQNAFDAVKAAQHTKRVSHGTISIDADPKTNTIKVSDNGIGMTADTVQKAFFTIAGTEKSDIPPHMRSGGLGLAKMAFIFGSDHIDVVTVRDGVRTEVHTDSEAVRTGKFDISETPSSEASGTTVTVRLPKKVKDPTSEEFRSVHVADSAKWIPAFSSFFTGKDVTVNFNGAPIGNYPAEPKRTTMQFSWGDADIYVYPKKGSHPKQEVLSAGIYQFDTTVPKPGSPYEKAPVDAVIDVHAKVEPTDPAYPFNNQREDFRSTVRNDILKIKSYLADYALDLEAGSVASKYSNLHLLQKVDVHEPARVGALKPVNLSSGNKTAGSVQERFAANISSLPKGTPILHSNLNLDFVKDLNDEAASLGAIRDAEQLLAELGSVVVHFVDEVKSIPGYSKIDDYRVGISLDKGYGGVHVTVPFDGIFLNPFYSEIFGKFKTQEGLAGAMLHVLKHEATHLNVKSHGADFAFELSVLDGHLYENGGQARILDMLRAVMGRHFETYQLGRAIYDDPATKNAGESLEGRAITAETTGKRQGDVGAGNRSREAGKLAEGTQRGGAEPSGSARAGRTREDAGEPDLAPGESPKASRAASPQTDLFGSPEENKRKVDLFTPRGQDNLADRAKSYLASFLDSDRTFNWWHRSVGTQYHKATVSAPFRRVFNEGQAFLTDTNRFSMQAEEKAPQVLLRVEGIKDLTKRPPSPAEIETLGRTLFEGTLFGGADPTKGKVFTDEELKAKGLNAKQVGLYRQVRASIDDSIDTVAKSTIARLLRTYEMTIDRDMSLADVTADALEQLEAHRTELNLAIEAQTEDPAERHRVSQQIDVVHTAIEKVDKIHKRAVALQKGGYMPLMRFGRYSVNVFVSAKGKKVEKFFGMYESQAEANRAARALEREFPDATIEKGIMSKESYRIFQGISPDTIELFSEIAGLDEHPLMQQFIQLTVSERSALKRLLERKGVPGFDWDVPKVLANFITSNARAASGNYHHAEMLHAIDDIPKKDGDVKDEAVRLYEYLTKPQEEAAALRGYMFFHFMGGSIATAMVNMTQPVMMTAPRLAVDHSAAKVAKELGRAMLEAARQNPPTDAAGKAMKKAEEEGIVAPHEIYQLMAEAKGGIGRNIALRQFTRVWGGLFSLAEAWNRKATFLAAYRLAESTKGMEPYAYAVRVVNETQGLYNRGNRPNWARGTIGATIMTFKQYSIAYLELLKRLPAPQRALALGILVLAAGLQGLPGADDLDDILDTLGQWMGYATNSKQWKRKAIEAMLGKDIGQFVLHGASAIPAMPLDVQMRLGLGNLIPGTSMLKPSDGADKGQEIAEVFGPAGGLAKSAFDVAREAFQGDIAGMAKAGLPASLRNAYQALEMFQTGEYRDSKNRRVVDASAQDAFVKAIGFNPTVVARESRKVNEAVTNINLQKETETSIVEQWVRGIIDHKDNEVDAARDRLASWNEKNPDLMVAINKQQIARRVREARRSREERFIRAAPKEIRAGVAQELRD